MSNGIGAVTFDFLNSEKSLFSNQHQAQQALREYCNRMRAPESTLEEQSPKTGKRTLGRLLVGFLITIPAMLLFSFLVTSKESFKNNPKAQEPKVLSETTSIIPAREPAQESLSEILAEANPLPSDRAFSKPNKNLAETETSYKLKLQQRQERRIYRNLLRSGWKLYALRKFEAAEGVFQKAIEASATNSEAYFGLAICLFDKGDRESALEILLRGFKRSEVRARYWAFAGSIYQWRGEEQLAREMYQTYLQKEPLGPIANDIRSLLARKRLPQLEQKPNLEMEF